MKRSIDVQAPKDVLDKFEQPVTSRVAAPLVHVHYKTLEEMARAGELPAVKLGKCWLFRMTETQFLFARCFGPADVTGHFGNEPSILAMGRLAQYRHSVTDPASATLSMELAVS